MQTASLTPERQFLNGPFDWLLIAIERQRIKMQGLWLSQALVMLISRRIIETRTRFYRLVERIRAGKFYPRKPRAPREAASEPTEKPPRKRAAAPDPMVRKFGWMNRLMPGAESWHCHQALQQLFEDEELAPLLATAPRAVWRELRPLCWMLGVKRPACLAPPPRPAKPKPPKPPKAAKPPEPRKVWPYSAWEPAPTYPKPWRGSLPRTPRTA
jgi:hypothetical protein